MNTETEQTKPCHTCRSFFSCGEKSSLGECHRNAPRFDPQPIEYWGAQRVFDRNAQWPTVDSEDSCGEHEPAEECR